MLTILFRSLAFLVMLASVTAGAAVMKVGDLRVSESAFITNSLTASNVIDRYNVRWWGADPTGIADSTSAISNALAYVGSGRLYVPQGTYRIITLHVPNHFVTLSGDGPGSSIFISSNAAPMFVFSGVAPVIEKIKLNGNGYATQGIHLTNAIDATVRDVSIDKIIGPGIFAQGSYSLLFDRCRIIQSHIGIHLTNSFANSRIDHCLLYYNTNYQVLVGNVGTANVNVSIQDSELESSGQSATNLLVNDVASLVLDGVYFESTEVAGKDIVVDGTTSIVGINGMYANGNGGSTNSIFVVGTTNTISVKNSFINGYATSPLVAPTNSTVENSSINGVRYLMSVNGVVFQPASAVLTNLSGTGALTNASVFQPGNTTLTNLTGTGALTNANAFQPASATLTNLAGTGALTNGVVVAGAGTSNAWMGGRVFLDATTKTTNLQATAVYTNLFTFTVPGNTLTNVGDELEFYLSGHFKYGTANTNGFKCIYGTSTLFDTGFLTISNCPWKAIITITGTGASAQRAECEVIAQSPAAGAHGNGAITAYRTNMPLAQVNGITNIFAFQGTSRVVAAITNDYRRICWNPGPR